MNSYYGGSMNLRRDPLDQNQGYNGGLYGDYDYTQNGPNMGVRT